MRAQILGHGLAIGLVLVIHVVAERVAALVKDHGHMGRCVWAMVSFDIAVQHVAEAGHRTDRKAI